MWKQTSHIVKGLEVGFFLKIHFEIFSILFAVVLSQYLKKKLIIGFEDSLQGPDFIQKALTYVAVIWFILNLYFCPAIHILLRGQNFLQGTKDILCCRVN